jgi:phosphoesterase RecJ-like protein
MGRAFADLPEPVPPVINIDHHITNTYFGSIDYVDGAATSTCEILYSLLPQLGASWTPDLASAVLTGIVTDTLCFRTVGVTSNTLHAASQLMSAGANLAEINMRAINVKPLDMMTLYQKGLNNMRLDNGLLWTSISVAERVAAGLHGFGNGGLASMLGDVSEAAMGAVLTEMEDGRVKANFRCRPPFDVAEVAVNLGGGGHALASGCTLDGPLDRAEALVVDVAKEAIKRQREMFG